MEVVVVPDPEAAAQVAADAVERLVRTVEEPTLGLATGSSPLLTYRDLIRRHREAGLSFAAVTAFLLDEYVGLGPDHPEAYASFIRRELTDHIDLPSEQLHGPDGNAADPTEASLDYERRLERAGGVDLQILGIGSDGHIGFNEPVSSLASRTRMKTLTEATRRDNARFFGGEIAAVPRKVITQGVGTILEARHLVLIATGMEKAGPIRLAVEGPVAAMVPASALQLHPHVMVIVDETAAANLRLVDYYREAYGYHLEAEGPEAPG